MSSTYPTTVAENLVAHRDNLSDVNKTLNQAKAVTGTSGVLETQVNHGNRITILEAKGFNPAACTDGTSHWVFVVGTNQQCYYKAYSGSWGGWTSLGGAFSSGLAAYCYNNGTHTLIWVYGQGTNNQLWTRTWSGTAWSADWVDLGGNLD